MNLLEDKDPDPNIWNDAPAANVEGVPVQSVVQCTGTLSDTDRTKSRQRK